MSRVKETELPLIYLNRTGGQDELIFDGSSFALNHDGNKFFCSSEFKEEVSFINFDKRFILSMGWQIIMVSFGAYAILMYLIKTGTASKTSNLFFLIPPTTGIMSYFVLGEDLYLIDLIGLTICTFGVYIATRK